MDWKIWNRGRNVGKEFEKEKQKLLNEMTDVLQKLEANNSDPTTWRLRMGQAISGGYDFADTLHNIYADYGYPETVQFSDFWNMYRRFGVAKQVVNLPVNTCWRTLPEVEGVNSQFNTEFLEYVTRKDFWERMVSLDRRQRVGRYAGLFVRIRDNLQPNQPIQGKLNGIASIIEFVPLYEGQLTVISTFDDPNDENFGMPSLYQYSTNGAGNRNEKSSNTIEIHPDRIIIAAEDADDGNIYGIPALESCFNSLMDLRKIIGAGGEGFYRNAAQNLVHQIKDTANANVSPEKLEDFTNATDDFLRNRMRRSLLAPGMETKVLDSNLRDPQEFFMAALNDIAAGADIPATILIGQQTGRLASDQDTKHFNSNMNSRRQNFLTDMVKGVIDWMIEWGAIIASEYEIEWDDLLAISKQDKLANSETMADINEKAFKSGADRPFTSDEIRTEAGFEELTPEQIEGEESDDIEPISDPPQ